MDGQDNLVLPIFNCLGFINNGYALVCFSDKASRHPYKSAIFAGAILDNFTRSGELCLGKLSISRC
jgi:hypothetical protein